MHTLSYIEGSVEYAWLNRVTNSLSTRKEARNSGEGGMSFMIVGDVFIKSNYVVFNKEYK